MALAARVDLIYSLWGLTNYAEIVHFEINYSIDVSTNYILIQNGVRKYVMLSIAALVYGVLG